MQLNDQCERFVKKWNSLPQATQTTVQQCLETSFIMDIHQKQSCPVAGFREWRKFNTPEEAADLAMSLSLSLM